VIPQDASFEFAAQATQQYINSLKSPTMFGSFQTPPGMLSPSKFQGYQLPFSEDMTSFGEVPQMEEGQDTRFRRRPVNLTISIPNSKQDFSMHNNVVRFHLFTYPKGNTK